MQRPLNPTRRRRNVGAIATVVALATPVAGAAAAPPAQSKTAPVFVVSDIQRALGTPRALGIPVTNQVTLRPADAPARSAAERAGAAVARMEAAGDRINERPYVYGGGHGSFESAGYDCSGSVSYLLHAARLLDAPLASGGLAAYGRPGKGRRVTIYANGGHVFMTIDGRRFDTIAFKASGSRWAQDVGSTDGYVVRHPPGL